MTVTAPKRQTPEALVAPLLVERIGRAAMNGGLSGPGGGALETTADVLLLDAVEARATDIHLDPRSDGCRVRFRIDGRLHDAAMLSLEQGQRLVRHFKNMAGMDAAGPFCPVDARLAHGVGDRRLDLRLATAPACAGEKMVIRLFDPRGAVRNLSELGLTDEHRRQIEDWLVNIRGMFVVTGPTGSGKTTTLYALLHDLNRNDRCVVTIEEPVEYQIDGMTQIQVDHRHDLHFAEGLRAMLRLDPDYLMTGELRDAAAAKAAVESCGGGRPLLTTIHAADAAGAITALRNLELTEHQVATSLRMIVAQRLVRRLCLNCRRQEPMTDADRHWLALVGLPTTAKQQWTAGACNICRGTGYVGRTGIFEVWRLDDEDMDPIIDHRDERALRRHIANRRVCSLLHDAYRKAEQGITSLEELKAIAPSYPTPPSALATPVGPKRRARAGPKTRHARRTLR